MSHVNPAGSWKALVSGTAVNVGGAWKTVAEIWTNVSGTWKLAWINFTASVNDSTLVGSGTGASETGFVTSNVGTVTPVGGTAPYTYAWTINGGAADSGPFNPVAQTSASTAFNATVSALDGDSNENWICTVTDDDSNETTVGVTVTLTWIDTS